MKEKYRTIDLILSITVAISLVANIVMGVKIFSMDSDLGLVMDRVGTSAKYPLSDPDMTTDKATGQVLLSGTEASEVINKAISETDRVAKSNSYIESYAEPDNSTVVIYNESGECITQTPEGTTTVFKNDGNGVYFGNTINYGLDTTMIQTMNMAAEAAKDGFAKVYTVPSEELGEGVYQYFIEVEGWDNIHKMYSYVDSAYADEMVAILKESIAKNEDSKTAPSSDILNLRYAYVFEGDTLVSGACYSFFGEDATGNWGNSYINWYFDGIYKIEPWKLGEDWYNFDYNDTSEESGKALEDMLIDLHASVTDMLKSVNEANSTESDTGSDE